MSVLILGGFLGSGKTTVLLQLARYIADHHQGGMTPLVILENEIGEVSIDGSLLAGFQVREIFSGCICCTMTADLAQSVQQICKTYDPAYILVEATGMANPEKVAQIIRQYVPEAGEVQIIGLADAQRWDALMEYMDTFITTQLGTARWIFLNKVDNVELKDVEKICEDLRKINPFAEIYPICATMSIQPELEQILRIGRKEQ